MIFLALRARTPRTADNIFLDTLRPKSATFPLNLYFLLSAEKYVLTLDLDAHDPTRRVRISYPPQHQ